MTPKTPCPPPEDAEDADDGRLLITPGDSLVGCSDERAALINIWARRNQMRSEKVRMFYREQGRWMEGKLGEGEDRRVLMGNVEMKRERQRLRQEEAKKRWLRKKEREAEQGAVLG